MIELRYARAVVSIVNRSRKTGMIQPALLNPLKFADIVTGTTATARLVDGPSTPKTIEFRPMNSENFIIFSSSSLVSSEGERKRERENRKFQKCRTICNCLTAYATKWILIFEQNKVPNDPSELKNDICTNTPIGWLHAGWLLIWAIKWIIRKLSKKCLCTLIHLRPGLQLI